MDSPTQQRIKDQDTHFHPPGRKLKRDSDYPNLDNNDVWFYQNELERHIRVSCTESGAERLIAMLWHLGALARRTVPKDDG